MTSPTSDGDGAVTASDLRASDAAYLISAVACAILVAIPFLAVTIPPITDLPQQTAQVRLLLETLAGGDESYRVQWMSPNKLGYLPLLLTWLTVPPAAAGRLGVLLIGLSWVAALHFLARATRRPPAAAALATLFFFNHLTYWGLLNFVAGLPVFALWFVLLDRRSAETVAWRDGLKLLAVALLLYSAHVLWLAAGLSWLVVSTLIQHLGTADGRSRRDALQGLPAAVARRLVWALPALGMALLWYPQLERSGFVSDTVWGRSPVGRLHPEWHLNSALGGLEGNVEPVLALVVAGWLLLGLIQTCLPSAPSARRSRGVHRSLMVAGLMFVAAALCLPAVIQSTIFFASRWLPMGVVLLVLACPQPRLRAVLRTATPYVILASLTAAVASTWIEFEDQELDGLHESLAAVTPGERVLGLDFVRTSERIKGYPFYHLYAYAQVLHGNELARPFTNLGSSLVVFRDLPRKFPWTEGLDWRAMQVRKSDMDHFGYVLIYGQPDAHALFLADERLTPVTTERPWRLYRIAPKIRTLGSNPRPSPSLQGTAGVRIPEDVASNV